jgi:hypothetical protein
LRKLLLLPILLVGASCAKFPAIPPGPEQRRIVFTMTLAQPPNPNYVYVVALRPTLELNPGDNTGPLPVVVPAGNGFVAGAATHFIRWDPLQARPFQIYRFRPGTDPPMAEFFLTGYPIRETELPIGGRTFEFEVSLAQIGEPDLLDQYRFLQVNFLTMNRITPGGTSGGKVWDALGDSRSLLSINDFIRVPLVAGVYDNALYFNLLEPEGDVVDPTLDIIDFSVQVRDP